LKKSSKVELGIAAALALSLTGCNSTNMQRCVDEGNSVYPEEFCSPAFATRYHWSTGANGQQICVNSYGQTANDMACRSTVGRHYHWYYGGRGGYTLGSSAYGGSEVPASGERYATATEAHSGLSHGGTSRGGFGRAGSAGRGA